MSPEDREKWNIIRRDRHENNDLYVDWMMASHDCPQCGPLARKYHRSIAWHDDENLVQTLAFLNGQKP